MCLKWDLPPLRWVASFAGLQLHVSDILSVKSCQSDPCQPQQGIMGPGDSKDKEQLLAEDPGLPGWADVWVRCHGRPVQPPASGLCQPDGEVLLVPLPRQRRLQLGPQIRHQAQKKKRAPVWLPVQTQMNRKSSPSRNSLQAVEVLREGGAAVRQEMVLEEEVQQQVELIEALPQEAKTGRVGLCQNLGRSPALGLLEGNLRLQAYSKYNLSLDSGLSATIFMWQWFCSVCISGEIHCIQTNAPNFSLSCINKWQVRVAQRDKLCTKRRGVEYRYPYCVWKTAE